MTFLTRLDDGSLKEGAAPTFALSQRGRAGLEILGAIQTFSSGTLRPMAAANFEENPQGRMLGEDHASATPAFSERERIAKARTVCEGDAIYRLERFFQRYVAEENFNRGIPAIEERRAEFLAYDAAMAQGSDAAPEAGSLTLAEDLAIPAWFAPIEWHLEPGGWDGYDLYGALFAFGVGPYVFSKGGYAAVGIGDDIVGQRLKTIRQFPKDSYARIYEPGCGGVSTLKAVHSVFPEAELHGADLSPLLLKNGARMAARFGFPVHLKQADCATDTGEADASFDGVITYALHHELPPKANRALFAELFRIMKPGADIVISDPPPFRAVSMFHAVILDWDTLHREEPFFSPVLHESLDAMLEEAGFEAVESYAIGQDQYPWITRARKPESTAVEAQA
ncbi:class I SAM-dependent methyltransferase [Novosphingobium profundi]|uniref:class I SAM-dependent methyltransferase n=1 Tax=Novosphingobium profundi TaxID=1774954 RepID=UPI001CFF410E|nr:class I SAM-dependent methyltransferase [Novosphingobium profundi]